MPLTITLCSQSITQHLWVFLPPHHNFAKTQNLPKCIWENMIWFKETKVEFFGGLFFFNVICWMWFVNSEQSRAPRYKRVCTLVQTDFLSCCCFPLSQKFFFFSWVVSHINVGKSFTLLFVVLVLISPLCLFYLTWHWVAFTVCSISQQSFQPCLLHVKSMMRLALDHELFVSSSFFLHVSSHPIILILLDLGFICAQNVIPECGRLFRCFLAKSNLGLPVLDLDSWLTHCSKLSYCYCGTTQGFLKEKKWNGLQWPSQWDLRKTKVKAEIYEQEKRQVKVTAVRCCCGKTQVTSPRVTWP